MQDVFRDLVVAWRGGFRRPGYALGVVATLAIGIGANTAIFSVFNWILFRPLPGVHRPGDLVTIRFQTPGMRGTYFVSYLDYAELRDFATQSLTGIAAVVPMSMEMAAGGTTATVNAEVVTANYLAVLGVRPALGRDFNPDEEKVGGPASVIISDALWRRAFGGDRAALGRTLILNGRSFTLVGIAPASFQGRSVLTAAEAWLPISSYSMLLPESGRKAFYARGQTIFSEAFARLRQGVSLDQAQAETNAAMAALPDFANRSKRTGPRASMRPVLYRGLGHDTFVLERLTTVFWLLMGAVGLLLLLACANAANLLLARSVARRREIAICQAIGASRLRIIRQQLVEGLVLSVVAGLAGIGLAVWLTWLFDGMRIVGFLPAVSGVGVDWRVMVFAMGASLLTGLIFSAGPAVAGSRVDLLAALKNGVTSSRGERRMLRGTLVTVQITVSVVLLLAACSSARCRTSAAWIWASSLMAS